MTQGLAKHTIKIRYNGGSAEEHELPLYDGTTSIHGIAQALQITTHAYLNDEIVSRATAMKGAQMFLRPAKPGSFLIELVALIEQYPATSTSAVAISAPVFYDFIKLAFSKATGYLDAEPETPHLKKNFERKEPFFDELAETLEGSLQRGHRIIGNDINNISIGRPRSEMILFNQETKNWVNTREEIPIEEMVTGNVTRFNSVTRNGRMYVEQLRKIIPFKPDGDFPVGRMALLTWSLHGSNTDLPKKLELKVRHVKSALGESKRFLLADCKRVEE